MLEDILQALHPETYLCIATDITLPTEYIKTKRASAWKKKTSICTTDPPFYHPKCSFCSVNYFVHLIIKMKKMKIKKRDVLIFVLGILAFLLFEVIYNWDGSQKAVLSGME
jgi:hypothetical protein